jgi:sarcosine oxidase subunit delta
MKLLNCPLNGPRNISEFTYGGEYHVMPNDQTADSREWTEYVYFHDNAAGLVIEWWCHTASSYWFLAERNTITDEVLRTFSYAQLLEESVVEGTDHG